MSDRTTERALPRAVAVAAVVGAFAWVGWAVAPRLSLTGQATLLLVGAVLSLVGAATFRRDGPAYLAVLALVAVAGFVLTTHGFGPVTAFGFLLGTLAVVLAVAYLHQQRRLDLRPREAVAVVVVAALVGGAVVGADLRYGEVSYETTIHETADLPGESGATEPVVVGTATARNSFVFRERVSFPSAVACVYADENATSSPVLYGDGGDYFPASVGGRGTLRTEMTVLVPPWAVDALDRRVPVERATACPDSSDRQRIVVVGLGPG
ncbi:MAG: hypothetical protein ABEJ26_01355 [Halosimplex sp.]